ncbi:fungal-specific transcription factor domain-containing protein [Aspergillus spectabilis]
MSRATLVAKAQALLQSSFASTTDGKSENDLRDLEPPPERDFSWDEVSDDDSDTARVADDINGLAVSLDSLNSVHASYIKFSSVPTILRVTAHLSPRIRQVVPPISEMWKASIVQAAPESTSFSGIDELSLINAYFLHVHPVTPMVDEVDFRQRYSEGGVPDNNQAWLALFNMVLAMGCFASDSAQFNKRNIVYERALSYLSLSSLGYGHLYIVQALALYGGYLLHYLNKPNTASAVIGATIRIAVAMGLHRAQMPKYTPDPTQYTARISIMTRIRTWWSIFCLDTWAAATLGRPGLGYWSPATTTAPSPSRPASNFCKIATRIQERLAQMPLITTQEITEFDTELLTWEASLHMFLANPDHCPPNLCVARGLLRCRFITTRLTLYRPCLLSAALHRKPWSDPTQQQPHVSQCVEIARAGIDIISLDWFSNHILTWNDAWHLLQITLVLVLAAVSIPVSEISGAERSRCDEYITKALALFAQMEPFNAGASRSKRIIQILYDNIRNQESGEPREGGGGVEFGSLEGGSTILNFLDLDMAADEGVSLGPFYNHNE